MAASGTRRRITESVIIRELGSIACAGLDEVKPAEKIKALELLGKYLGMWSERTELSVTEGEVSKLGQALAALGMRE